MYKFICPLLLISLLTSCKSFMTVQTKELYNENSMADNNEINGFKTIQVFQDDLDKSVWVSPETQCVKMQSETKSVFAGKSSIDLKWDKIEGGCKWIGIGFGWNNWMAKDMMDIDSIAAIQMQVKLVSGKSKNFPVAFAFEDYSGTQCYYGFQLNLASGEFNDSAWTAVTIPLSKFNFKAKDFDLEKVKQFIIQLEGDGHIYLDDIKFIKI
jgi:hypothetical protein